MSDQGSQKLISEDEEETEDMWTRCASREEASRQTGVSRGVICEHLNSKTAMALGKRTTWFDDGVRYDKVVHGRRERRRPPGSRLSGSTLI